MKRFICEVERIDKYIVEIDETKFDKEAMERFKEHFYDFDTYEEHAIHLSQLRARFGTEQFEGYRTVLIDGKRSWVEDGNSRLSGINIKVLSEDEECKVSVREK